VEALPRSPALLVIVLLFVLAEAVWRLRIAKSGYDAGAAAASFGVAGVNLLLKPVTGAVIGAVFLAVYEFTPLRLPIEDWRVWLVGFAAVEFVYYWFHRWSHTVRWLWASHAVHHTAQELTLPAAIRLGWTNLISGGWLLFAPLVALGFHPVMVAAMLAGNLIYQFFLHTEAVGKLGPLEWILNTPSHHRVHHASNPAYIDKNFGGVVIIYDRMFGTFAAESAAEPPRYGLVHPLDSHNPIVIALHEWGRMLRDLRSARSLRDVASATLGRPR
jgi:sterol desaturase/sphingolipid hydroxylase (fatty acid hydroxylase superfamily)